MSINYPTSLDTLANPTAGELLENAVAGLDHDTQHSNANDAIEALEAKVGVNSSAVTTSHDYKLGEVTGSDKAVGKTATQTLTNKTLTSPILNLSSNATGDMYYRKSDGTLERLPIGTTGNILDVSAGGVPEWVANPSGTDASTTQKGVTKLDTAPASATNPIAVGVNSPTLKKLIGVGGESNTTYENYQLYFGLETGTSGNSWTSWGSPTYRFEKILTGSAVGVYRYIIDMATGANMNYANTKIKILEWDALIQADATTGSSFMGFQNSGSNAASFADGVIVSFNRTSLGFRTNDSGNWFIFSANGSSNTATSISNPSAGKHTFRIEYNGTIPNGQFYIDGVLVGTITTTISTSSGDDINIAMGNGTSSVIIKALSAPMLSIEK